MSASQDPPLAAASIVEKPASAASLSSASILVAQAALAVVFIAAGVLKTWTGPATLHPILAALGVPADIRSQLAYGVPAAEIALGRWLVSGLGPRACCSCTIVVLTVFVAILVAVGIRTDWRSSCACLGMVERSLQTAIAQDAALLVLAGYLAWRLRRADGTRATANPVHQ
ncbi:MAG: DoxX family membrane protein [Phycisphaerae bacterium]|jgi:uncharacterized membrane protein YphA (DoxX/SURF4 family)